MPNKPITAPCGTRSAYFRHLRQQDTPCEACRNAQKEWQANYRKTQQKFSDKLKKEQ